MIYIIYFCVMDIFYKSIRDLIFEGMNINDGDED
jgi:hypothetical protein